MVGRSWEEAFLAYSLDAAVGRLFRGLTHNLNGVAQAFSMQTELLTMLFSRIEEILSQQEKAASLDESKELAHKLAEAIKRRAALVVHLDKEVRAMQEIMHRTGALLEGSGNTPKERAFALGSIIDTELEFMNADGFFKHRVRKDISIKNEIPVLTGNFVEIHQILGAILENSSQALAEREDYPPEQFPSLRVTCEVAGERVLLSVADNGSGIREDEREKIFEPFYTSHPERLGLGLYLARKLAERCNADLVCNVSPGETEFILSLPLEGTKIGQ